MTNSRFKPSFKPSMQDTIRANNKAMEFYSAMSGKPTPDGALREVKEKVVRGPRKDTGQVTERDVSSEITSVAKQHLNGCLWRNNRGQLILPNGGRLTYGVGPNGASDYIGFKHIIITQEMVGQRMAQFVALEAKRPGAKLKNDQQDFLWLIDEAGGLAGVARSGEDAIQILLHGKKNFE